MFVRELVSREVNIVEVSKSNKNNCILQQMKFILILNLLALKKFMIPLKKSALTICYGY